MKEGDDRRKIQKDLQRLQHVADWCNEDGCRREKLLGFFGEPKPTGTSPETCCCNCERRSFLRKTGVRAGAARTGSSAVASISAASSSFQSAGGGTFSFRNRGGPAGSGGSCGNGGSRAFTFSRGTSMASTKFKAPRRLGDDGTGDGGDDEVDQESSNYSSSSFVFRGGPSFQSARWQGRHEGFGGSSDENSYSHAREEPEQPLRGQALVSAARARAEAGPTSFSSAARRPSTSGAQPKKKRLAKTVDLF